MTPALAQYLNPELIQQVARLDLRARFIVEGFLSGIHSSPFHGFSAEFSEHRKYAQGDDPRTIDWAVFGRTDRLYVRRYRAETHLNSYVLVDVSASMGYVGPLGPAADASGEAPQAAAGAWPQPPAKMLYAIHLAAALGYLVLHQQDAAGLALLGAGLQTFLPARARLSQLPEMLARLAKIVPAGETGLAEGLHDVIAQVSQRGLFVLISDLLTDREALMEALHRVRFRGHDLIVMHVLDASEVRFPLRGHVRLEDPETGEALTTDASELRDRFEAAVEQWRSELRARLAAMRSDYVALDTNTPFDKALVEFLAQRRSRR